MPDNKPRGLRPVYPQKEPRKKHVKQHCRKDAAQALENEEKIHKNFCRIFSCSRLFVCVQ
jgi:hypothetical protein